MLIQQKNEDVNFAGLYWQPYNDEMLSQISFPGKTSEGEEEAEEDEGDAQPADDGVRLDGVGEGGGQVQIPADDLLEN